MGTITFGIAESTHVAIHEALGRSLDFGGRHSEAAKALALIGIHLGAGAMIGAGAGVALAALSVVARVVRRATPAPPAPLPQRGRGVTGRSG